MDKHLKKGYTLIEILVALLVFSILATITSSSFKRAFDIRKHLSQKSYRINSLRFALSLIERDLLQATIRTIIVEKHQQLSAFIGHNNYVEFTRTGIDNPQGKIQRSTLQRVAFLCDGKSLKRRTWSVLDSPKHAKYTEKTLLTNLNQCHFAFLSANHQLLSEWRERAVQQNQNQETLPTAIQFTLELNAWGTMNLLYPIAEGAYRDLQ
ncbi:MAG: type II secretion system minor pseudopilin GspJ [Legionella sp.]